MKPLARLLILCTAFQAVALNGRCADLPLADGERIVFAGDSLTYHDGFPSWADYVTSYLVLAHPGLQLHIHQLARSGVGIAGYLDTSPTGYQHYSKWIEPLSPDYVFAMFADNGGYSKEQHKAYMQSLVNDYIIGRSHATPLLIGMIPQSNLGGYYRGAEYDDANEEISLAASPVFRYYKTWQSLNEVWRNCKTVTADAGTNLLTVSSHGFENGERVVLDGGSAPGGLGLGTYYFVRDATANSFRLASNAGGAAIDLTAAGSPQVRISSNWAKLRGTTAMDAVHPSAAGSLIAAWKIISGLGWTSNVSSAVIDSSQVALTSQNNCAVTDITENAFHGIDFHRKDARLPWAIDEFARADAVSLYPAITGWQNYTLKVTGLSTGNYEVFCNDELIATVPHTTLAAGWNMADLTIGPVWRQGQEVLGRIRDMQGIDRTTLFSIDGSARKGIERYKSAARGAYDNSGKRGEELVSALAPYVAELDNADSLIRAAAQPQLLSFSIRRKDSAPPPEDPISDPESPPDAEPASPDPGGEIQQPQNYSPPAGVPVPRWDGYDPINASNPVLPAGWSADAIAGRYYVDSENPAATDTANPYGFPEKPRLTIPAALPAGAVVVVAHCRSNAAITASGTAAAPVWILGEGEALLKPAATGTFLSITRSSHLLVDGINFDGTGAPDSAASAAFSIGDGSHHVCIRNSSVRNMPAPPYNPTRFASGGAGAWYSGLTNISPRNGDVSEVVLYNNSVVNNAGGQSLDYESGRHCLISGGDSDGIYRVENVWVLNCLFENNPEDGIQLGQTSSSADATLCRNFYIAGNTIRNNGENAIDLKACDRIVVSKNQLSGYMKTRYRTGAVSGSDGTACVINDDGRGPLESWWLFNTIHSCRVGIRNQAAGGEHYVMGNLFYDLRKDTAEGEPATPGSSAGVAYWQGASGASVQLINNTLHQVHGGFYLYNAASVAIQGNVIHDLVDHGTGWPVNVNNAAATDISHNFYYDPDGPLRKDANALAVSDSVDANLKLAAPDTGDFRPASDSPLIGQIRSPEPYDVFIATFEVNSADVKVDLLNKPRPLTLWAAGALEPAAATTNPLGPPGRLRPRPPR